MNNLLKLLAALIAFSSYSNAITIFDFTAVTNQSPTTTAALFNATDESGNLTNQNNTYGTTDTGNGSGWGSSVTTNFDGSVKANPGDQNTAGSNTTTYFGPTFYAGVNRDAYKGSGGVMHSNGNGFRIRVNNVTQGDIDDNVEAGGAGGANGINFKTVFMFDANGADTNNYGFGAGDTLNARLAVANNMGPGTGTGSVNRAYSASYRAMVKADGEYYVGSLYDVDLAALSGANSSTFDLTENGASATWTLMDNMESSINSLQWNGNHPNNLTVDGTTTVLGSTLTGITQVGFYLETTAAINTGGYNFGVRQFSAEATAVAVPEPSSYALIAGMIALASIMLRRRQ